MPPSAVRKRNVQPQSEVNGDAGQEDAQALTANLTSNDVGSSAAAKTKASDAGQLQAGQASGRDVHAIVLLVVLYMLQGIPVGLAFGTMPFLLKTKLSYADIGTFALSTYPYSLKLAWSPIVDSCWVPYITLPLLGTRLGLGRRKSWIVPVQLTVGAILWFLGGNVDRLLLNDKPPVITITALFFTLVLFAATQDIAVDGWALTLLSQDNLSYASTAQTVGLNIGYFMSFTVFLALNSVEFSNKYLRSASGHLDYPVLSLSGYLKFASVAFVLVTLWLAFFKNEEEDDARDSDSSTPAEPSLEDNLGLRGAYEVMWKICKLRHVQMFLLIHLVAKIGFQANEAVTGLKLVEKGFSKEDLALAVLIDFPFQIVLGYLAARWSKGDKALTPWLWGYGARLLFAVVSMGIVAGLASSNADKTSSEASNVGLMWFVVIIVSTVAGSFASTVQFVGISAFHTQIADPLIGGTYMTLLNTVSNLGGTWPRYFVLKAVDAFTRSECRVAGSSQEKAVAALRAASLNDPAKGAGAAEALLNQLTEDGKRFSSAAASYILVPAGDNCATLESAKQACLLTGTGRCVTTRDGYFITSTACVVVGLLLLVVFILPQSRRLEKMKLEDWRVTRAEGKSGEQAKGDKAE
ncbi:unnamed protein product [Parajaminaea phylloscopi]